MTPDHTPNETAAILKISRGTLHKLCRKREISFYFAGSRRRFTDAGIESFRAQHGIGHPVNLPSPQGRR
jgi:excisionase family DNA binding protein